MTFLAAMRPVEEPAPEAPRPKPIAPKGLRGAALAMIADHGAEGIHVETLAVRLWQQSPAQWGMKRHPEYPDLRNVVARVAYLRSRGLIESCPAGERATPAGRRAARAK